MHFTHCAADAGPMGGRAGPAARSRAIKRLCCYDDRSLVISAPTAGLNGAAPQAFAYDNRR